MLREEEMRIALREEERRRLALREEDRRNALRAEERRRVQREEERRRALRLEALQEEERLRKLREEDSRGGRLKASPVRFRAPETTFLNREHDLRGRKNVNFEPVRSAHHLGVRATNTRLGSGTQKEMTEMLSNLRDRMGKMQDDIDRLESLISNNF